MGQNLRWPYKPPPCHCDHVAEDLKAIKGELRAILAQLGKIECKGEHIVTALDNLKAADDSLKAEVVTFLADIAARLGAEDPDIQAVADDVNAQVAALQGADTP